MYASIVVTPPHVSNPITRDDPTRIEIESTQCCRAFGSESLRESGENHWGLGLGGGRILRQLRI